MRRTTEKLLLSLVTISIIAACSGCGGGSSGSGGTTPTGTPVTVTFAGGAPLAVAEQIGTGAWATATAPGGQLTLSVPTGTTTYAIAYVCPTWQGMGPVNQEFVIEATTTDNTTYAVTCFQNPSTGTATGVASGSAIPGATQLDIVGKDGYGTSLGSTFGQFSGSMPTGSNDVSVVARDASFDALGVKIVRAQTVPGAINGGSSITLAASDATTLQSIAVSNIPSGFNSSPAVSAQYITSGGTSFGLMGNTNATQYAVVPSTEAASGDYYSFSANTADTATQQSVFAFETTTSAGAMNLQMPTSLPYAAPTPAALPSFTLNYAGFSGASAVSDSITIEWSVNSTLYETTVTATSAFLNGATALSVPDLTSLTGFFPSAASGTNIYWLADVYGGTYQWFEPTPTGATLALAQNSGQFTEP